MVLLAVKKDLRRSEKNQMNAKKKGNKGENTLAKWFSSHGFKCHRNSSSGGGIFKSDIHNSLDLNIECKTVKRINLKDAWSQTCRDSSMSHATPTLFVHLDGMAKDNWLVVMSSDDWIEMAKASKPEEITETQTDRNLKWALEGLKMAINKVLKYL